MIDSAVILAVSAPIHDSQLNDQRPRAMLPALGKPMVVRVMDRLYRAGIRRYNVIVGINEGGIASYINTQWMPDTTVEFTLQSNEPLALLLQRIARQAGEPFLIVGYNSFTVERFIRTLFKKHDEYPQHLLLAGATMTLSPDAPTNHYASMDGGVVKSVTDEKPVDDHFVLSEYAVCGEHFVHFLQNLAETTASSAGSYWFDIVRTYAGTDEAQVIVTETSWLLRVERDSDLLTLNKRLLDDSNDGHVLSELPYSAKIIPPVRIDPQVSVGQRVVIGPYVYIERGSSIGYGAKIKNSVVLQRGTVPADSTVEDAVVTAKGIVQIQ